MEAVIENKFEKPFCIPVSFGPNTSLKLKVQNSPKGTDVGEAESQINLNVTTKAWRSGERGEEAKVSRDSVLGQERDGAA